MKLTLSANAARLKVLTIASVTLTACNPAGDPLVDMCQKITGNLVGTIESWAEPEKTESGNLATTQVGYTSATGEKGIALCKHPKENGSFRTSPTEVTLNGELVPQRDLMAAAFGATKQIVKDTAEHTKEKSIELTQQASEKAKALADDAQVLAEEAKVKAEELTAKAETLAGEAREQAAKLADEARAKASELASQASELSAAATEKARAAALEATKAVQDQLEK